ncbi:MAG: DNA adenine methylase [Bacteroidales bacterium]|jgi:DNA adenine methylase|nr:DNA adenine methylase [Bacteroidales bacterium]
MENQLSIFNIEKEKLAKTNVVNVASVPQRSPFRYPGGKTWLIPTVRNWLRQDEKPKLLHEPFAGGGIVSLTAAFENFAQHISMVELDEDVAAVWDVLINGDYEWLANKIFHFELTSENISKEFEKENKSINDIAFCTILKNRIFHGGIITKGSGLIKNGENGKGILSRWYPKTLRDRMMAISMVRHKLSFMQGDGFSILESCKNEKDSFFFIDPPYTKAGRRLYTYFDIDHEKLFEITSKLSGKFMMTYDDTIEIRELAEKYNMEFRTIPMKTTHHIKKNEIILSDNFTWWK